MIPLLKDSGLSADERLFVRGRIFLTLMAGLLMVLAWSNGSRMWIWLNLILLTLACTIYVVVAGLGKWVDRAMAHVIAPDLIAAAGFTYLLANTADGFYPIAVIVVLLYAIASTRQNAQFVGVGIGVAYLLGHVFAYQYSATSSILLLFKGITLPLIAWLVAVSVERRRLREAETVRALAEKQRIGEEVKDRLAELQAVSQITEMVHSSLDLERTGPAILQILAKVIGVESCCLFVIDKEKSDTLFSASTGIAGTISQFGHLDLTAAEEHFSCMSVFDHINVMVMFCASADVIEHFTDEDLMVLGAVASELVVAVENSRLYKLTKTLAVTDELTSLANYRHLQQRLDEEIERSRRYGKRLSMLMIDVDDFKRFNDTQGHLAGDAALRALGETMQGVVREVDTVARYGGEEFSVVLPETDAAGAFVAAEKIREAVAQHVFADAGGHPACSITISIGLATFPTHAWDKESLLREADDALYNAKNGGKNRVRVPHKPLVDGGPAEAGDADTAGQPDRAGAPTDELATDEWTEN